MEMQVKSETREILAKLIKLQTDMSYVKEHIEDITLTGEDIKALETYEKEKKGGKLVPHMAVRKQLNL